METTFKQRDESDKESVKEFVNDLLMHIGIFINNTGIENELGYEVINKNKTEFVNKYKGTHALEQASRIFLINDVAKVLSTFLENNKHSNIVSPYKVVEDREYYENRLKDMQNIGN